MKIPDALEEQKKLHDQRVRHRSGMEGFIDAMDPIAKKVWIREHTGTNYQYVFWHDADDVELL